MNKEEIRKSIKYLRSNLSKIQVITKSKTIQKSLLDILKEYNYTDIFIYNSFKNEVSTKELIEKFCKTKNVYLPKIINGEMHAIYYTKNSILEINSFGIDEPDGDISKINNFICIMPLLATDEKGNRIGFGKGYYDKFLQNKKCLKIGLCYDFQIIKSIPCDTHDIPLDIIISEKRTINLS